MCIHSMCSTKFSYMLRRCTSRRSACPVQTSSPSRTVQVSGAVLMLTQPVRSLPLNRSTHCAGAGERGLRQ